MRARLLGRSPVEAATDSLTVIPRVLALLSQVVLSYSVGVQKKSDL